MTIEFSDIQAYRDGKAGLMAGLLEQIKLPQVFDKHLTKQAGRPAEIPYGVLASMMLVNMTDDHHPLSRMAEYFKDKDIESLFGLPLTLSQLNDDRFGGFLDLMYEAGPSLIFSEIATNCFFRYNLEVTNINFDTTSKVMWGQYKTAEGIEGVVEITNGHSKQKRGDKNQIKISLGTTNGIVMDGQILSGNLDDKTYNKDNLDRLDGLLNQLGRSKEAFYYIADSAAFSKECLLKAQNLGIHMITRMPDNVNPAKDAIREAAENIETLPLIEVKNTKGTSCYRIKEQTCIYKNIPLKLAVCYSEGLIKAKEKTLAKQVEKEHGTLSALSKDLSKRQFVCLADAEIELAKINKKELKKLRYHQVELTIEATPLKRRGRPSLESEKETPKEIYTLAAHISADATRIKAELTENCIFVLCSTDLNLSAEMMLQEYKTQSCIEKKFQQLKSPQFVNSLYVDSPTRVEALGYLMLISIMVLSVAEYVVRKGLADDKDFIIGPDNRKMTKPSLFVLHHVFFTVQSLKILNDGKHQRGFNRPLEINVQKIMKYLGIPQDFFIRGCI